MTDNAPLVSIVIPVYNGAAYLAQAIESALAQSYAHCEVIVVNDGSNDCGQSERIAMRYAPRIRYFSQPNGGVASALNLAIFEMQGSYFSWLSHDDVYLPHKVERQMALMRCSEQHAVYSDYRLFSDDGDIVDIHLPDTEPQAFRYRLALQGGVNGCTLLIPVEALRTAGGFDESLHTTQDYALWFLLAKKLRLVHLPEVLVSARVHTKQGIFTRSELAWRESKILHANFARDLETADLPMATDAGFTQLAKSFWRRGFDEAALISEQRARSYGVGDITLHCVRFSAIFQRKASHLLRRLLSPIQRARIRQSLRRLPLYVP
ncbi:Hyaluronan synthase [Curvibacter sp. AEP1-3]|uniref:glycosyltransferase family 2 protein n=1 Tax=Curvibacter sp. AEP1-3 TaxID=1844971 RepID=UPI000B3C40B8|nr:glycosyltransferase [Curvibacter sp. AEP1-3]ARV18663.1 Hyaluronan synthase [Curvibacter sp. AEP1-3]